MHMLLDIVVSFEQWFILNDWFQNRFLKPLCLETFWSFLSQFLLPCVKILPKLTYLFRFRDTVASNTVIQVLSNVPHCCCPSKGCVQALFTTGQKGEGFDTSLEWPQARICRTVTIVGYFFIAKAICSKVCWFISVVLTLTCPAEAL